MNLQTKIRNPAVAGSFYPNDSAELASTIQYYLDHCDIQAPARQPVALIVPHAGYIYSATIAASAYSQLLPYAEQISRVVLLGPSHRVPLLGVATSSLDAFQTPLGKVSLDRETILELDRLPFVKACDEAHLEEHCLEVQLPFLQQILSQFMLVPLLIGQIEDQQVSDLIETLLQCKNTLVLISSDLSHYLNYESAVECDRSTCRAIEELQAQNIYYEQACGRSAIAGMLLSAKKHNLQVKTLDLRNSGDTAGTKERVVGYGAWAFFS